MADSLYTEALTSALDDKTEDLAGAHDVQAVKKIIDQAKKDALEQVPYRNDSFIYRVTVIVLGLTVLFVTYAQFALATAPKVPEGLIAIGSAAIGALAGILSPIQSR